MEKREPTDFDLMDMVKQGDRAAFRNLMDRYATPVYNYLNYMTKEHATAEDLCQEVFLKVYENAAKWKPKAQVKTWIFRIAHNMAINELKAYRRKADSLDEPVSVNNQTPRRETFASAGTNPEENALEREKSEIVSKALEKLPENQRTAILLKRFDGFSYKEIAAVLDCSVSAVESLIFRGRQRLKEELKNFHES